MERVVTLFLSIIQTTLPIAGNVDRINAGYLLLSNKGVFYLLLLVITCALLYLVYRIAEKLYNLRYKKRLSKNSIFEHKNLDVIDSREYLKGKKALIIGKDDNLRELLRDKLSYYLDVVTEGNEILGFQLATEENFDIIVCNVATPRLSGFEITRRLKENFETCHIPVVLIAPSYSSEEHMKGIRSGADVFVAKPFDLELLITQIIKVLEQRIVLQQKFSSDRAIDTPALLDMNKDSSFMDKFSEIIEQQIGNPELSIEDFISQMSVGRTNLYSKVRKITGCSPMEYVRIIRMNKAAELLLAGEHTSAEIAYKVGLNDPAYFSKCFKAQFGVSPSGYHKQMEE